MKIRLELSHVACAALLYPAITMAASNPASQDWVKAQIAATVAQLQNETATASTLSAADWAAVCQSGNINSSNGCYGDAGSQAFAKINLLGGNPLGYAGVTGSAVNSVWIRQVGAGTSCTTTNAQLSITNTTVDANSTLWICGVDLTNGSPVSSAYALGVLVNDAAYTPNNSSAGILFSTIAIGNMLGGGTTALTSNALYFAGSTILPTAYVFCISTTNTSAATPFAQAPATSLNGAQC